MGLPACHTKPEILGEASSTLPSAMRKRMLTRKLLEVTKPTYLSRKITPSMQAPKSTMQDRSVSRVKETAAQTCQWGPTHGGPGPTCAPPVRPRPPAVTLRPSEPFLLPRPGSSESGSTLARLVETNLCNQHGVTVTVCVYTSTMNHTTVTGYCQASCVTT